jgi:hypothetical protein
MLSRVNEIVDLVKRETPKIGGSAAAFITLVTILVLIIAFSCSAVVYLMLEDMSHDAESQNLNRLPGGRYQLSVAPSDPTHHGAAKTYFAGILGKISGSRKPNSDIRKDKPGISRKSRGQGWLQAGSSSELELSDSADERQAARKPKSKFSDNSTSMTIPDRDSVSLVTLRPSTMEASPPSISRLSSPSPDAASSVHFDPNGVRGLSYTDQLPSSSSLQAVIPNTQSQLYSSQYSSSRSLNEPQPGEVATASPAPDNDGDLVVADPPRPLIRTFESGSRFIEGL